VIRVDDLNIRDGLAWGSYVMFGKIWIVLGSCMLYEFGNC
jgi:hypothetical protein